MNEKARCDDCICNDPWRFDEKKIKGDIDTMREGMGDMWAHISKKVQMSVFVLVITLLSTTMGAIVWASYDTTKSTYQLVAKIDRDIAGLKSQQQIINKFIPVNIHGSAQ